MSLSFNKQKKGDNMKPSFCKEIGAVILLSILATEARITCNETYVLIFESKDRISCTYDSLFISVRWYTADSLLPIAVLERGRSKSRNGYGIAENGDLVIHPVTLQHERNYGISVVDKTGSIAQLEIAAIVIVPLNAHPHIFSCKTSGDNLCQNINQEERQNVLICQTNDTRPGVNFRWSKLSSQGEVVIDPNYFLNNVTVNNKTKLFSSTSRMRYDHHSFRLQYFTCEPTGVAVRDDWKESIFVEGDGDTKTTTSNVKIVDKGLAVNLQCFDDECFLRRWRVTYLNGTVNILETFPADKSDVCHSEKQCSVDKQGTLTIRDVTHSNEGHYECICGKGNATIRSTTEVIVRIAPTSEEIFIQGCKNNTRCDKVVSLRGIIQATVYGTRPPIDIKCTVADRSETFIFNDKIETVSHVEKGTFDTIYSVEYNIQECSAPVHVVCKVVEDSVHDDLPTSNVYLKTDTSRCSNEKGPWVAIVLIVIFVTLIVTATIVLYVKRKQVQDLQERCFQYTTVRQSDSDPVNANTETTPPAQDKKDEAEKRDYKDGEKTTTPPTRGNEESGEKREYNDGKRHHKEFEDLYAKINANKIESDDFRQEMETFSEMKDGNLPHLFLSFVTSKDLYETKHWEVVKFVGGCVPCFQISSLEFVRKLADLVKQNKLEVDKFLKVCEEFCIMKKISKTNYVEITEPLVKCDAVSKKTIEKELANIEKVQANKTEWADWLLKYSIENYSKDAGSMQTVTQKSKLLPYPYFLLSTYRHIKRVHTDDKVFSWFKDIITSNLKQLENCLKDISDDTALSLIFAEALCLSVESQSIQSDTCVELLLTGRKPSVSMKKESKEMFTEERAIKDTEIYAIFTKICQNFTVSGETCTEILYCSLQKSLIKESFYTEQLEVLRKNSKIELHVYVNELGRCFVNQQITQQCFEENLTTLVEAKTWSKGLWVKIFVDITKKYQIDDKVRVKLFRLATKTYEITKSQLKTLVKDCGIAEEELHSFISGVKVHATFGNKTIKSKEVNDKENV